MDFTGKVALVTGGGRGIGRATALVLARKGADVAVNYLQNDATAGEVVKAIQEMGRKSVAIKANVGVESEVEAMFADIDLVFGRIDILVNNAGTGKVIPLDEITLEFWNSVLQVDLTGPFLCTRAAAKRMTAQKYGRIVNISSIGGVRGIGPDPSYTAAKSGLIGFTRSAARYLGQHNITVNTVSPGPVHTELSATLPDSMRSDVIKTSALGRWGRPEDVADAILFFASDYSRHVTGQMILADGGIHMP
jgi:3-oxoacyl-[acyl-carrier protein] reductase